MDPSQLFESGDFGAALLTGAALFVFLRCVLTGFYTVAQNERAVKVRFGRAERLSAQGLTPEAGPAGEALVPADQDRYFYPQLHVIPPGGPYFKLPWERIVKVDVSTQTLNMAVDLDQPKANQSGTVLEAVTKDQLDTGLSGQIRYRISEKNLYAYLFGVKSPIVHVMGYFISILRERIANFEAPRKPPADSLEAQVVSGVSINDLRKNLRDLNEHMDKECKGSEARYGIVLDASLITGIDPPQEVESALAAINTAHNHVSSEISLAQAAADQKVVQSRRAVEIETLRAQAEVEPLVAMAQQLELLQQSGPTALESYLRNARLSLVSKASYVVLEASRD